MTYVDPAERRAAKAAIATLQPAARRNGYSIEYHPITRVRGWPARNTKPFALYSYGAADRADAHLASFATFEALERGFRARAGL